MIQKILSEATTSISALKKNPMAVVEQGNGFPVAVLNHNQPAFYCIPAAAYEAILDQLEDIELRALIEQRESNPERTLIEVTADDL